MISAGHTLNEIERDALTELANIGISRAASSLRKMIGEEILLSVPSVEVVDHKTAAILIGERETEELVAVRQDFTGGFSGRALLIFPQANSLELIRTVVGEMMSDQEMADIEEEALAETGNIILKGCLASMSNMLKHPLDMALPEVLRGDGATLFELDEEANGGLVLFFYINFWVRNRNIRGYIAMLMDLVSLESLKVLIKDFIDDVMDDLKASN